MEYYRLASIKTAMLSHVYHSEHLKHYVRDNYFTNLFFIFDIKKVYIDNSYVIITKKDFKKIIEPIKPYIKEFNETVNIPSVSLSKKAFVLENPTNSYIIGKYTRNFVTNNIQKGLDSIKRKASLHKKHFENLQLMEEKDFIFSFDFEYNGMSTDNVSEIGMALYFPKRNEVIYKYYILDNQDKELTTLQQEYRFGTPVIVNREVAFAELRSYLKSADFLMAHDITNELKILNMKPNWNRIIDTKSCELYLNPKCHYLSLKDALHAYDIKSAHLHNAGNDAAFTFTLAKIMLLENSLQKIS